MEPVNQAKVIAMVVLAIVSLLLGLLPIWLAKRLNWKTQSEFTVRAENVQSALLCFGVGVLMSTALSELLPEVHQRVGELREKGYIKTYAPLAGIFFGVGFFAFYLMEEAIHWFAETNDDQNNTDAPVEHAHSDTIHDENDKEINSKHSHNHEHHKQFLTISEETMPSIRSLLVVLGLSLHGIFEGMAIGLQDSPTSVYVLFAAVASHEFVIIFCVGIDMASTGVKVLLHVSYMVVLAVITSIGIGIGMGFSDDGENDARMLATVALQGIAGGTLIYVAFFEVLERERLKSTKPLLQWASILFGYMALVSLQAMLPEHHHHEHHHAHLEEFTGSPTTITNQS